MFDPIPEEKSSNSNYLRWSDIPIETDKDNKGRTVKKVRLRLMGSSKIPGSLVQCWTAWEEYQEVDETTGKPVIKKRPHRAAHNKNAPQYLIDLDKDKNPKKAWNVIVWHVEDERPLVWEITQSSIKDRILSLVNNTQWGGEDENGEPLKDVSRFTMEFEKHGELLNSEYFVNAEPTGVGPAPQEIVDKVKDAMIDVRVLVNGENDGNPFGALATNDQENIRRLREQGEPIPMGAEVSSVSSVGSVARDAVETLKAAKDKAEGLAPEMEGKVPY